MPVCGRLVNLNVHDRHWTPTICDGPLWQNYIYSSSVIGKVVFLVVGEQCLSLPLKDRCVMGKFFHLHAYLDRRWLYHQWATSPNLEKSFIYVYIIFIFIFIYTSARVFRINHAFLFVHFI